MKELDPHITQIFQKYLVGKHTAQELDVLLAHFGLPGESDNLKALIEQQFEKEKPSHIDEEELNDMIAEMEVNIQKAINPPVQIKPFKWWYVAASIFLVFSIAAVTYFTINDNRPSNQIVSQYGDDVAPGKNSAYITLSNGKKITLDSNQTVLENKDGKMIYSNGEVLATETEHATITTPIGGEFQIILPDGTKAWLNAASTLKYPVSFKGNERSIEAQGEIYLEVAKDKKRPFKVSTAGQRIEVLGTEFNLRNYGSNVLTTLIEGKIALTNLESKERITLSPGQQASVYKGRISVKDVDPSYYTAWKDGILLIKDATLIETCAELERWYGVKFIFPAGFTNNHLALNSISRNEMLSSVLAALKNSYQVEFDIRGKEVFVK